jgi:hypothetical protein
MAASTTVKSQSYDGRYLELVCTQTKDIATNKSTIDWTLYAKGGNEAYYSTGPTTVKINGETVYSVARKAWSTKAFPAAKGSVTGYELGKTPTVAHDNEGKAEIEVVLSTAIYNSTVEPSKKTWTLDDIPRAATLTGAPHFTDEDNPTITYSNPAGENVTSIKACIADANGQNLFAAYRDIPKTGTSYTFNLTDAERNALRWATINSPNLTVKFYVTTVIGGVTYYSTLDKIMTITNAEPTIDATIKDMGGTSVALTGDQNKIIKGFNYIQADMTATAYKGASIKKQTIECGGTIIDGASGNFENVESADFIVTATDSRGYTTTQTITKALIDYIKLTCNLTAGKPNAQGEMSIKINGHYFNGSFGKEANTLQVQFRYKAENEDFGEWIDANPAPNISGNTYDTTIDITGLDYRLAYTFQARAIDKVNTAGINSKEKRVKAIPVFDWGENDFQFNVDAFDKNGGKLGTEIIANDYDAVSQSGKTLLESGWVTITPVANTPTAVYVSFKKHYNKIPVVVVTASTGVIGTQVSGASINGITNDGVNIVTNRTNTTPTTIYYHVFGEVE